MLDETKMPIKKKKKKERERSRPQRNQTAHAHITRGHALTAGIGRGIKVLIRILDVHSVKGLVPEDATAGIPGTDQHDKRQGAGDLLELGPIFAVEIDRLFEHFALYRHDSALGSPRHAEHVAGNVAVAVPEGTPCVEMRVRAVALFEDFENRGSARERWWVFGRAIFVGVDRTGRGSHDLGEKGGSTEEDGGRLHFDVLEFELQEKKIDKITVD